MSDTKRSVNFGTSPVFLLFLCFLVLKLTGVISWSWWWVTAPLWGVLPFVLLVVLIPCLIAAAAPIIAFIGVFIWEFFKHLFKRRQ
jgi:hypothetical protein